MTVGQRVVELPFDAVSARSGWRRHGRELSRRRDELSKRAAELLDGADGGSAEREEATEAIAGLTSACVGHLREQHPEPDRSAAIAALVCDLQRLALELHEHELARRIRRVHECEAGLARLRAIPSTAGLIDRTPLELARSCGFDRALLSRVEGGTWSPWVHHFAHPEGMQEWLQHWIDTAIPLREMTLEARLLTDRRAALSHDTGIDELHPMVREALSNSYAIAPIMPAGKIVGFFHADHGPAGRRCDRTDRDVLWAFTEAFGHIYERAVLLERLRSQRERVRDVLTSVGSAMEALDDAELDLASRPGEQSAVTRTAVSVLTTMTAQIDELTPREMEVLELIVFGASNRRIAERLVVTEETVKSHVKHILRKLGAANRSQVIAQYAGSFGGGKG